MADTKKVVTVENLNIFKNQIETVIDTKIEDVNNMTYATEQDILDLFTTSQE